MRARAQGQPPGRRHGPCWRQVPALTSWSPCSCFCFRKGEMAGSPTPALPPGSELPRCPEGAGLRYGCAHSALVPCMLRMPSTGTSTGTSDARTGTSDQMGVSRRPLALGPPDTLPTGEKMTTMKGEGTAGRDEQTQHRTPGYFSDPDKENQEEQPGRQRPTRQTRARGCVLALLGRVLVPVGRRLLEYSGGSQKWVRKNMHAETQP